MTKRLFSLALAMLLAASMIPVSCVAAKTEGYDSSKALKYAQKNWNNGVGLCADFVSKCLQAGGVDVYSDTVKPLYNQLKDAYGTAYKLKLTGGKSGKISMSANKGKLEKGDPVFYKCNYCGEFEHVVICNGEDSNGYCRDYAHNNAHNGKKTTYTYRHCGGESWTLYSVRMYEGPKLYGKKTNVGVPEISSLKNAANGIAVKWTAVKNADKYYLYRKTDDSAWQKIKTTASTSYTDKKAENGKKYTYTVRAVKDSKLSQHYAGDKVTCIAAPVLSSVKNNISTVKLTWKKVSGADGYYVYRRSAADSTWQKVAKLKGSKQLTYTDADINSSESYKYTVRAYDNNVKGCYDGNGIKTIFLTVPDGLTAVSGDMGIVVNFNVVDSASKYEIYRKADGGDWEKISIVTGQASTGFVDLNVEDSEMYRYSVKAINGKYSSGFDEKGVVCEYTKNDCAEDGGVENVQTV